MDRSNIADFVARHARQEADAAADQGEGSGDDIARRHRSPTWREDIRAAVDELVDRFAPWSKALMEWPYEDLAPRERSARLARRIAREEVRREIAVALVEGCAPQERVLQQFVRSLCKLDV